MKLVIFDIDGTLTNTSNVHQKCFVQSFADAHAISGINTNWAEYPHMTDSGITLHIFQERLGRAPESNELRSSRAITWVWMTQIAGITRRSGQRALPSIANAAWTSAMPTYIGLRLNR